MTPQELGSAAASETPTPLEDFAFVRDALRLANFVGDYNMARQDSLAALARLEARIAEDAELLDRSDETYYKDRAELAEARVVTLEQNQHRNVGIVDELSSRVEALSAALRRLLHNAELIFDKKPVRDWWGETLAEAHAALATSEQADDDKGYCTCAEGADGNPCASCGKPEAVTLATSEQARTEAGA
jgi:predicted nuclease with TOPRIM domain